VFEEEGVNMFFQNKCVLFLTVWFT